MSSLSTHLLTSFTSPSSSCHQTELVQSNSGVYQPAMHGNFSGFGVASSSTPNSFIPGRGGGNISYAGGGGSSYGGDMSFQDISLATAQHIGTLQAKLDKKLGPEYISTRPGGGGQKLTYVEGWKAINLANEVFGFNGWSSSIQSLTVDYIDYNEQSQKYNVGVTAIVRITLRDGVYHEDLGYGAMENTKQKGPALDKCKKEAVTDAIKRTLRNFGNVLGNCLYDKTYVAEVSKIKVPPPKFDRSGLHRRPEFEDPPLPVGSSSNIATSTSATNNSLHPSPEVLKPLSSVPLHVLPRQPRNPPAQPQTQQGKSSPLASSSSTTSKAMSGQRSADTLPVKSAPQQAHQLQSMQARPQHAAKASPLPQVPEPRAPEPPSTQDYFGSDDLDSTAFADLEMVGHDASTAADYDYIPAEGVDGGAIDFEEGLGGVKSMGDGNTSMAGVEQSSPAESDKENKDILSAGSRNHGGTAGGPFKRTISMRLMVEQAIQENAAGANTDSIPDENTPLQQPPGLASSSTRSPQQMMHKTVQQAPYKTHNQVKPQSQPAKTVSEAKASSTSTSTNTAKTGTPISAAPSLVMVGGFHFPDGMDLASTEQLRPAKPSTNGGGVGLKRAADGYVIMTRNA
ncbi:DNA repair protein rad52 [Tulasnella sp. 332]|nr:DNA repair protein rad52 [Tulasnella sp. 332]